MNLNKKDVQIQAKQFLSYFSKLKDRKLNEAFRSWVNSKDFNKETERAIRYTVYGMIRYKNAKLKRILKQKGF